MKPFSRSRPHTNSYRWAPVIVSGIALLLALATTYYVAKTTEAKARERFDLAVQQVSNSVEDLVNGYVTLLHAVRGLAYTTPSVSRQQFRDYVGSLDLLRRYPGTQGIGFSVRIPADKKEELARTMRDQGIADFHIHPETARAEYHAIVYLEPLDERNRAAIGYDMFTEPVRRAAMEKARDTGELSASGRVTLMQEIDERKQAGFLIYLPIYRSTNAPATVEERREKLSGFIYSPFRADDLLKRVLAANSAPPVAMEVYDGPDTTEAHLLHRSSRLPRRSGAVQTPRFTRTESVLVGDRAWSLVFSSQPEFFLDSPFRPAPWVLATGLAFSVLLFSVTRSQAMLYRSAHRHATELEQRVARRTAQLEAANRDLQKEAAERNRAELQIRESQRELREYVDNMSTLNAKVALDGTLLLVNRIAEIGSGLSREELMRTKFLEGAWWTFDPDVLARATAAFQRAVAGETVNYDETLFVFGRAVPINFSLVPVRDESGQVAYLLAEGRDISALKRAEQALKLRTTELEAAVQELEAFSYSVSHDLRAPVRHIGSFSEMILADSSATLDANSRQNLMIVRESARRMGRLIDDLLSFSRMARSELSQTTVDTARLVEAIVETLRRDAPDRRVEWNIGPLPKARGDQAMLELVFTNLLSNALKYTHTREAAVIEIGARPGVDSETVFFVRDNGVGFDMKYIGKLFHVFQRLHRAEEFEGTGIGLANVRRIVHRHGGRVWAESAVERGATFFFSLPNQHHTHDETQKNPSG